MKVVEFTKSRPTPFQNGLVTSGIASSNGIQN
jgi:hypothetical protein